MVKRFVSILIFMIFTFSLTACGGVSFQGAFSANLVRGSGILTSETRQVSGFDRVQITGSGEATITVGDSEGIKIEAEDNILPLIETTLQNGKLVVGIKPNTSISTTRTIRYTINAKSLAGIEMTGSANAVVNPLKAASFSASTSGSGNIKVADLQGTSLKVNTSGSGNIEIAGKVDSQEVTLSGSGNYTAGGLQSTSAQVGTSGSANAMVWVKDSLNARTSGSGDVKYYGQPAVTKNESGSGRVSGLGNK